ncbi:MAG: hypothetical protein GW855_06510 [Erythrobacter sp.]|nr:hypothetical protein [Erythrobacter sp.]NCQ63895.1 hypothetical protein [Alphaproteobacteria bacterium]
MRNLIIASTAACGLALAAAPAIAQQQQYTQLTASQQATYDAWTAENRATYDAWPMEAQTYYWTLNDSQADIWWNTLNNDQRVKIVQMMPQQRTAAWQSINSQLNGTATGTTTSTRSAGMTKINYMSNAVVQPTPGDAGPPPANLPICEPMQQDNCINRGAR